MKTQQEIWLESMGYSKESLTQRQYDILVAVLEYKEGWLSEADLESKLEDIFK